MINVEDEAVRVEQMGGVNSKFVWVKQVTMFHKPKNYLKISNLGLFQINSPPLLLKTGFPCNYI